MKRFMVGLLSIMMVFTLVGCSSKVNNNVAAEEVFEDDNYIEDYSYDEEYDDELEDDLEEDFEENFDDEIID